VRHKVEWRKISAGTVLLIQWNDSQDREAERTSITRSKRTVPLIRTGVSSASSGNSALKISLRADYTLSRYLTLTAYYDRQTNTPLLSSSSYPTTTHDFGFSMRFSLTR